MWKTPESSHLGEGKGDENIRRNLGKGFEENR
jgi:hypothetical protein